MATNIASSKSVKIIVNGQVVADADSLSMTDDTTGYHQITNYDFVEESKKVSDSEREIYRVRHDENRQFHREQNKFRNKYLKKHIK